jgi:beta-hydroxylase
VAAHARGGESARDPTALVSISAGLQGAGTHARRSFGHPQDLLLTGQEKFPFFFHGLHALERLYARFSLQPEREIHAAREFPWVDALEAATPAIQRELGRMLALQEPVPPFQEISPEQRNITEDDRWRTYVLFAYGVRANRNCRECPETAAAVARIPGMKTALFSILSPHKHIPAHRGPYKGLLRCHLGLSVPEPDACRIRVGSQQATWSEGRVLIFDDTFEHEVWNDGNAARVVLFIDFLRPMRAPLSWLNRAVLWLILRSPYGRQSMRRFSDWYAERGIDADL